LPDNYEIQNQSLWDIKYNLRPHYTKQQLEVLDKSPSESRGLDGTEFLPGFVGLNNLKNTDYVNVVIQAFCRVPPLRDFFIFYEYSTYTSDAFDYKTLLSKRFAELIRKIWNERNFKGHVSPHELLQAISLRSNKQFRIGHQSDPITLLAWFLSNLEKELLGISPMHNVISECFRGAIEVQWFKPLRSSVGYEQHSNVETKSFKYRHQLSQLFDS
jgi:U4/U6.U5 tri-snRNP-associated protein 2